MKKRWMFIFASITLTLTLMLLFKFNDKAEAKWYFSRVDISNCVIKLSENEFYRTGKEIRPEVTVSYQGKILQEDNDYIIEYKNNVDEGKARVIIKGINEYRGKEKRYFNIITIDLYNPYVTAEIEEDTYEWTGEYITPSVKVYYKGQLLKEDEDYYLRYRNNKDAGEARVVIYGMNMFSGAVGIDFFIKGIDISEGVIVEKKGQIYVYLDDVLLDRDDYYMSAPIELSSKKIGRYNADYDLYRVVYKYKVEGKGIYYGTIEDILEIKEKRRRVVTPTPTPTSTPTPTVTP